MLIGFIGDLHGRVFHALASPRWHPEARGLQPGCLGTLDTASGELIPVRDPWLSELNASAFS